ncbi:TPA: dihydropteroate synthase, partial [Escherichia coli]|nr:dihydropteroate synthase [Escherichia coli]HAW0275798.1 dihydropteroate synthase [Escherichia coli]
MKKHPLCGAFLVFWGFKFLSIEDSFFDESRRLDPAGAVTAAIEMLRVGSDVVDVGPAASHPDARPVSPADEIRRIAPLLDALSDQMHR